MTGMTFGPAPYDSSNDVTPLPAIEGKPVYGCEGYQLGTAVDFVLDFDANRVTEILVENVDTERFPHLDAGRKGVRVPFDSLRSIEDAIVVDAPLSQFAGVNGASPATLDANSSVAE